MKSEMPETRIDAEPERIYVYENRVVYNSPPPNIDTTEYRKVVKCRVNKSDGSCTNCGCWSELYVHNFCSYCGAEVVR